MNVALNFILRSKLNENQLLTTSEKVRSATYIIFDSIEGLGPSIKMPVVHTCKVAVCPSWKRTSESLFYTSYQLRRLHETFSLKHSLQASLTFESGAKKMFKLTLNERRHLVLTWSNGQPGAAHSARAAHEPNPHLHFQTPCRHQLSEYCVVFICHQKVILTANSNKWLFWWFD